MSIKTVESPPFNTRFTSSMGMKGPDQCSSPSKKNQDVWRVRSPIKVKHRDLPIQRKVGLAVDWEGKTLPNSSQSTEINSGSRTCMMSAKSQNFSSETSNNGKSDTSEAKVPSFFYWDPSSSPTEPIKTNHFALKSKSSSSKDTDHEDMVFSFRIVRNGRFDAISTQGRSSLDSSRKDRLVQDRPQISVFEANGCSEHSQQNCKHRQEFRARQASKNLAGRHRLGSFQARDVSSTIRNSAVSRADLQQLIPPEKRVISKQLSCDDSKQAKECVRRTTATGRLSEDNTTDPLLSRRTLRVCLRTHRSERPLMSSQQ